MKKKSIMMIAIVLALPLVVGTVGLYNVRDRNPGYMLDFTLPKKHNDTPNASFKVGVAKRLITPMVKDTWVNTDDDPRYEPKKGDYFIDKDGNGKFDALWLSGFMSDIPVSGIHDDLWVRTIIWDDGQVRVALVVLDATAFLYDDVISVREMIEEKDWGIDHVIVSVNHSHGAIDLVGGSGPSLLVRSVDEQYLAFVKEQIVATVGEAQENSRPAFIKLATIDPVPQDLLGDLRPPYVIDDTIYLMQICDTESGDPFGLLMNWGVHPHTVWWHNSLVTNDFIHYWLDGVESGIVYDGEAKRAGVGGIAIFANGASGGQMSPKEVNIHDPWLDEHIQENGFEKARTMGYRLADIVLAQLERGGWQVIENPQVSISARTFLLELQNRDYALAAVLGVFDRGAVSFRYLKSEVNLLTIGPVWMVTIPGEIYPEIVDGGVEIPAGADYPDAAVEAPPIREMMRGDYNLVIGCANDYVGYLIPKTQWDVEPPFTYDSDEPHYGEAGSVGPDGARTVHRKVKELIDNVDIR